MSEFVDCTNNNIDLETLLKSLFVRNTSTGAVYLNLRCTTILGCEGYEPAVACDTNPVDVLQLLRQAIISDRTCVYPALQVVCIEEGGPQ